MITQALTAFK